jgi:hypothetical protein
MTKKSSFFDTLKKGLKMAVFGGLRKVVKNRHFLMFFRLFVDFDDFDVMESD